MLSLRRSVQLLNEWLGRAFAAADEWMHKESKAEECDATGDAMKNCSQAQKNIN